MSRSSFEDRLAVCGGSASVRVTPRMWHSAGRPCLLPSIGEYGVYDDTAYDFLTADRPRTLVYQRALARCARDRTVLDIGCGRDANWARTSIEAGARRAYGIEELADAFRGAEATVARLGLSDRIRLIEGRSTAVALPERVDLCVSEIIGVIGSAEGAPAVLGDARRRHLAPGATMIPERCVTRVAGVELPDPVHAEPALLRSVAAVYLDRIFGRYGRAFDIRVCVNDLPRQCIVTTDDTFEDLDFCGEIPVSYRRVARLCATRDGRLDGLVLWPQIWALKDERPLDPLVDGGTFASLLFLPLFWPGQRVRSGDVVTLTCESELSDDGVHPDYRVTARLQGRGLVDVVHDAAHHAAGFRSNAFYRALFEGGR